MRYKLRLLFCICTYATVHGMYEPQLKDDEVVLTEQQGPYLVHVIAKKPKPKPVEISYRPQEEPGLHLSKQDKIELEVEYGLLKAVEKGDKQAILAWLPNHLHLINTAPRGKSALFIAAELNKPEIVNLLLPHGANVNITTQGKYAGPSLYDYYLGYNNVFIGYNEPGLTPMHAAASHGFDQIVTALLAYKPDLEIYDPYHETALHMAVKNGRVSTAVLLLQHGANAQALTAGNKTSLHIAAENNRAQLIDVLQRYQKDINAFDSDHLTPLHTAVSHPTAWLDYTEFVRQLLRYNPNVDTTNAKQETPLITAIQKKNKAIAQLLLEHGADTRMVDADGHNALYHAISVGSTGIVDLLALYNVNIDDCGTTSSLEVASNCCSYTTVSKLIQLGANMHLRIQGKPSCLNNAAQKGNDRIVRLLLNNSNDEKYAEEYLHGLQTAAANNHCTTMRLFFAHGGYLYAKRWREQLTESLLDAFKNKNYDAAYVYLEYEIPLPAKCIHMAVADHQLDIVRILALSKNVDLTEQSEEGLLPEQIPTSKAIFELLTASIPNTKHLIQAIDQGDDKEFTTYLEKPVELTYKDNSGNTPLHHAVMHCHTQMVQELLQHGADPTIKNDEGHAPISYALPEILKIFITAATPMKEVNIRTVLQESKKLATQATASINSYQVAYNRKTTIRTVANFISCLGYTLATSLLCLTAYKGYQAQGFQTPIKNVWKPLTAGISALAATTMISKLFKGPIANYFMHKPIENFIACRNASQAQALTLQKEIKNESHGRIAAQVFSEHLRAPNGKIRQDIIDAFNPQNAQFLERKFNELHARIDDRLYYY